jgi:enoyl-[acyl-carrier protein] reductase I
MDLAGKRLLITAPVGGKAFALSAAALAQQLGAEVVLASPAPARASVESAARGLPEACEVLGLDVEAPGARDALREELGRRWGRLDGTIHPTAHTAADGAAPADMEGAEDAFVAGAYSLSALARAALPLMGSGGSMVGLTFGSSQDRTGVRGAVEAVTRYLACSLGPRGVRVNLVATSPAAADGGPDDAVARASCFLLSDWARAITGEVLHVASRPA